MTDVLAPPSVSNVPPPADRHLGVVVPGVVAGATAAAASFLWFRHGVLLDLTSLVTSACGLVVLAGVAAAFASGRRVPVLPAAWAGSGLALGIAVLAGGGVPGYGEPLTTVLSYGMPWALDVVLTTVAPVVGVVAVLALVLLTVRRWSRPSVPLPTTVLVVAVPVGGVAVGLLVGLLGAPAALDTTPAAEVSGVWEAVAVAGRVEVDITTRSSSGPGSTDHVGTAWFDLAAQQGVVTALLPDGEVWEDLHDWRDTLPDEDRSVLPSSLHELREALHAVPTWRETADGELVGTVDPQRAAELWASDRGWFEARRARWDRDDQATSWPTTEMRLRRADDGMPSSLTVVTADEQFASTSTFVYRRAAEG